MYQYPKNIQNTAQLLQKWSNAGMQITANDNAEETLDQVGYYRLKGYAFHLYDKSSGKFETGVTFAKVANIYRFDSALSNLVFSFIAQIEVSLRARLVSALLLHGDALVLNDPSLFSEKDKYWKNQGTIASEIARSNDVFIKHNFRQYDGAVPLWASVEVMSFGTLSKVIKNLKPTTAEYKALVQHYRFIGPSGKYIVPSQKMFTSWIQSVSVTRNICAHNSRIYNRAISTAPQLTQLDFVNPQPQYNGLYQILLAMKYLRPSDDAWNSFVAKLSGLFSQYPAVVDLTRLNFPSDWRDHFKL